MAKAADWNVAIPTTLGAVLVASIAGTLAFPQLPGATFKAAVGDLWQVQAGVLGFAVALSLYAMQLLGRYSTVGQSLPVVASFPATVNIGLGLLISTGLARVVMYPFLAAWLALATLIATAVWLLLVGVALTATVALHDPRARITLRRSIVLALVERSVERQALMTFGIAWLDARVPMARGTYSPLGISPIPDDEAATIRVGQLGQIVDINLHRLRWALGHAADWDTPLEVGIRPGQVVSADSVLAVGPARIPELARLVASRALAVGRTQAESLDNELELLREDAGSSLAVSSGVLGAVLEIYTETIEYWAEYSARFTAADLE